jgi:two-component system sensor histidine kinase AgrC
MQIGLYEWANIIIGIFEAYIIYKFMKVFFDTRKTSKRFAFFTYVIFYIFSTIIFLLINIPMVLMIYHFIALVALSFNYESSMKNRILSAVFIYLILSVIEIMISLLTGYLGFSLFAVNTYSSIFGLITCKIISFAVVLILTNFKNIKRGGTIPNSSWLCIVSIPMASFYIALLLLQARGLTAGWVFISIALLLLVNFGTFYLYDMVTAAAPDKMQSLPTLTKRQQISESGDPDKYGGPSHQSVPAKSHKGTADEI